MIGFSIHCRISISVGKRHGLCSKIDLVGREPRRGASIKTVTSARAIGDCVGGPVETD